MLSKCANPVCSAPFRYLHQGRIFSLMLGPEPNGINAAWDHVVERPVERYWLCEACARTMTLCRAKNGVVVRPLSPAARQLPFSEAA